MIRHYTFNYNIYAAEATFKVDTEKFTAEKAQTVLNFFAWSYNKKADPIDEAVKKYALKSIFIATAKSYNTFGVKEEFFETEGFYPVDGSEGIELMSVEGYEFDEEEMDMTVVQDTW